MKQISVDIKTNGYIPTSDFIGVDVDAIANPTKANKCYNENVLDKDNNQYIVKVINVSETAQPLNIKFDGMKKKENLTAGRVIKLQTDDVLKENSIENPNLITPKESVIEVNGKELKTTIEPQTFAVYILKK